MTVVFLYILFIFSGVKVGHVPQAITFARLENSLNDVSDDDNFVPSDLDGTPGRTSSVAGDETAIPKTPNSEGFSSPATSTISSTDDAAHKKFISNKSNTFEFKQPTSYQHDM